MLSPGGEVRVNWGMFGVPLLVLSPGGSYEGVTCRRLSEAYTKCAIC